MIYLLLTILLGPSIFYTWYSLKSVLHWKQLRETSSSPVSDSIFFSIIIPVRNEAKNIAKCLDHLLQQSYPRDKFEIIVVNDHSSDDTVQIVQHFAQKSIRILNLSDYIPIDFSGSYKKKALEYGISEAKGSWIISTDGDVWMGCDWLQTIANTISDHNATMVCGPVLYEKYNNHFEKYQGLDLAGMMLITAAGFASGRPQLCNGANLAIRRDIFYAVEGYSGNAHIASGDDLFLLEKVCRAFPNTVHFAKSTAATVYTSPTPTYQAYLSQRLRWGTKTAQLDHKQTLWTLSVLWFNCLNLFAVLVLTPILGWPFAILAVFLWASKTSVDYLLLKTAVGFWRRSDLLRSFWLSELYHTSLLTLLGLIGLSKRELNWKERNI